MATVKLVSPTHRGTKCTCRCWATLPPAGAPRLSPTLSPAGANADLSASVASRTVSQSSLRSSSVRSSRLATCRYGSTKQWPLAYGYAFKITKHLVPRATMWVSSSGRPLARMREKIDSPSCGALLPSGPKPETYSDRHPAHRRSSMMRVNDPNLRARRHEDVRQNQQTKRCAAPRHRAG